MNPSRLTGAQKRSIGVAIVLAFVAALLIAQRTINSGVARVTAGTPAPTTQLTGSQGQLTYADIVDRVSPAVVTIRSARRERAPEQFPFLDDPLLQRFFGGPSANERQRGGRGNGSQMQIQRALGSGVIVRADGHILTNHHVVDGAQEITVELPDRRTFEAKLVGSDAPSDLAVLKINSSNLPVLALGDSTRVRVGDIVLALGNPLGLGQTVTAGIISAKGRSTGLSDGSFEDFLQTDAAINQGNSGGGLVNTASELIGINSQILSPSGGNIGIGFAIPSNMAKSVMTQLVSGGKVHRGQLGIGIQTVTSDLAASLGLNNIRGVLVNSVKPGSPADRAGIKQGDVIVALNGKPVNDTNSFRNEIAGSQPGTKVNLTVLRNGKEQNLTATLGEFSVDVKRGDQGSAPDSGGGGGQLGLSVEPLTADAVAALGLRSGTQGLLVRDVDPVGPAAEAGIQPGDVIVEVNRRPVRSTADIRAALRASGSRPALVLINRNGQTVFLTVRPRQ